MRVLVNEDNEFHRKITKLMLARLGYESDIVPSGHEAIQAISKSNYNLVLMDIKMPEMDGLEATREIRKLDQNSLRIIGFTAYVAPGIREMCIEAGMDDCISKPVRINELADVLKKYAHYPTRSPN